MTPPVTTITGSYDPIIVAYSVVIAAASSYTALDLAGRVYTNKVWHLAVWLVFGSFVMGIGIWSMHFTGMRAFELPVPVSYHWPTALLSFCVAMLASLLALFLVSRRKMSSARAVGGGCLMGFGIVALHYLNMFSMRMRADCRFNPALVTLSVGLAIVFSYSALRLAFYFRDVTSEIGRKIVSASIMAAAICAMHYTGMAAATFTASAVEPDWTHTVTANSLGSTGSSLVTLLILGLAILSSTVDRRFEAQTFQLALARANLELASVSRAASLGELALSIAHEINQPLGAVVNSSSATLHWLGNEPPNLKEAREAATQTVLEANRASEVIARIRALLKKETPRMESTNLNEVIPEVLGLAETEIAKWRVTVKTDLTLDVPTVLGDRVQLQQVMLNLMINAIEAMQTVKDKRELRIVSRTDPTTVHVSVEDTGIGAGQEDLDQIFHAFYTTKHGGTGMGLSIARSIIETHGGQLWAESRSPKGMVFQFTLPRANGIK
jgi:NO-binding membrane sensor protein with MHYT domain/nitrogen-specific signal transduction histidine kinase